MIESNLTFLSENDRSPTPYANELLNLSNNDAELPLLVHDPVFVNLETWQAGGTVQKSGMFNASKLTPEQKEALKQRATEGATLSDLQRHLKEDFGHILTYMDTRFLILDLGIELIEEPKVEAKKEEKPAPVPTGKVTTTMDTLTLPGALVSGKVTFSDGETGVWMLDQTGRPGLDPDTEGYRPLPEDIKEFQLQLRDLIQKSGL